MIVEFISEGVFATEVAGHTLSVGQWFRYEDAGTIYLCVKMRDSLSQVCRFYHPDDNRITAGVDLVFRNYEPVIRKVLNDSFSCPPAEEPFNDKHCPLIDTPLDNTRDSRYPTQSYTYTDSSSFADTVPFTDSVLPTEPFSFPTRHFLGCSKCGKEMFVHVGFVGTLLCEECKNS